MNALPLEELVALRIAAKRAEDDAAQHRKDLDSQIAELMRDPAKMEGAVTKKIGEHKITVTYGITRSADTKELQKVWHKLTAPQQDAFSWKASVSLTGLRACSADDQLALAQFIEAKPSSPSVKVELA